MSDLVKIFIDAFVAAFLGALCSAFYVMRKLVKEFRRPPAITK